MFYRKKPEPRLKTGSPPIRWKDYLRYWVRVSLRWASCQFIWLLGAVIWATVWGTANLPVMKDNANEAFHGMSWMFAGVWTVGLILCGLYNAVAWSKKEDRLER